jgi:hypothetical protein
MQRLKSNLNFTATIAMIYIVIKKNLLLNETQVRRSVTKHATKRAIADNLRMRRFPRVWRNSAESRQ